MSLTAVSSTATSPTKERITHSAITIFGISAACLFTRLPPNAWHTQDWANQHGWAELFEVHTSVYVNCPGCLARREQFRQFLLQGDPSRVPAA